MPATADEVLFLAGSGSELEESGKSSGKKLDAMTLIKEGKLPPLGRKPGVLGLCLPSSWDPQAVMLPTAPRPGESRAALLTELSPCRHEHLWPLPGA